MENDIQELMNKPGFMEGFNMGRNHSTCAGMEKAMEEFKAATEKFYAALTEHANTCTSNKGE